MKIEEIETVKKCEFGFMVNGIAFVPDQKNEDDYLAIQEWAKIKGNKIEPMFTDEELEEIRTNAINQKARAIVYGKYPQEKQSSAQLGIYGDEYLATMKAFIKKVIDISNKAIDDKVPADEVDWDGLDK